MTPQEKAAYQQGYQSGLTKAIELISTHTEHDGSYCDTGEDMEWACRSECIEMAVRRLRVALESEANRPEIDTVTTCEICKEPIRKGLLCSCYTGTVDRRERV